MQPDLFPDLRTPEPPPIAHDGGAACPRCLSPRVRELYRGRRWCAACNRIEPDYHAAPRNPPEARR